MQSGKPVGVSVRTRTRPRAHRQLEPRPALRHLGALLGPRAARAHHVRPDDRGSWIYIGTQGILQGTYETFAQAGRTHFGTDDLAGRLILSSELGGWAARRRSRPRCSARRSWSTSTRRGSRSGSRAATSTRADDLDDALLRLDDARRAPAALDRPRRERRDGVRRAVTARDRAGPRHGPDVRARSAERLRARGRAARRRAGAAAARSRARSAARKSMARQVEAMLAMRSARACSTTATTSAPARARRASPTRSPTGFVPAYIRPMFCEGKVRSAGWRSPAIRPTSPAPTPRSRRSSRRMRGCAAGSIFAEPR